MPLPMSAARISDSAAFLRIASATKRMRALSSCVMLCGSKTCDASSGLTMIQRLTKIQGMTLIIMDDDFPGGPGRLMHVFHQRNAVRLELGGKAGDSLGFQVEMEMSTLI